MRTKLRSKVTLLFMMLGLLVAVPAVALADILTVNDLVTGGDVTKVSGESGQAVAVITPSNDVPAGDANGCNASGGAGGATLTLTSSDTTRVNFGGNASASQTVNGCGNNITFNYQVPASATAGTATITATATGGKPNSKYSPDSFIVTVIEPTPPDNTGPVITPHVAGTLGNNGWYVSDVAVTWEVEDEESEITSTSGCDPTTISTDTAGTTLTCEATSAGGTSSQSVTIKRDATAPTINHSLSPPANANGWNNEDVLVDYSCSDATSGVASCGPDETLSEGANQSSTGTATDNAGNTASDAASNIDIDKTDPNVALVGGPADGSSHYFGSLPSAAPTCTASDALSGINGACSVSGYGTTVGNHTVTASATDNADNNAEASSTYTVLAWTLKGFYQPVDMTPANSPTVYNTVKGGSTVPFKFEVFAGPTELTDVATTIGSSSDVKQTKVACDGSASYDDIEATATGGTSLRYDTTGGQFVFNWQTPKAAGSCYKVTVPTKDGSSLTAYFRLK